MLLVVAVFHMQTCIHDSTFNSSADIQCNNSMILDWDIILIINELELYNIIMHVIAIIKEVW